jgi:hypothetical protein
MKLVSIHALTVTLWSVLAGFRHNAMSLLQCLEEKLFIHVALLRVLQQ